MEFIVIIAVILILAVVQAVVYEKFGMKDLEYKCSFNVDEAFEGDEIELVEEISNHKLLPMPWLKSEITAPAELDFGCTVSIVTGGTRYVSSFFMLRSYRKICRRWRLKCLKRGVFAIERISLVATDLLGEVSLDKPVICDAKILILPRPYKLPEQEIIPTGLSGETAVSRRFIEDPFLYSNLRPYIDGDPLNRIVWNAFAKTGEPVVYCNESSSDDRIALFINIQSRPAEDDRILNPARPEGCIKTAASFLDCCVSIGVPVRIYSNAPLFGEDTPFVSDILCSKDDIHDAFRSLALLQLRTCADFGRMLSSNSDALHGSDIIIISSYLDDSIKQFAADSKADGKTVKILYYGGAETHADNDVFNFAGFIKKEGA